MASNVEVMQKRRERAIFLQEALTFDEVYRQALARVQFMKTRYKKAYDEDQDEYTFYGRAKRLVSKFEYAHRKMVESETAMLVAQQSADVDAYKKADEAYEKYMKNCLYYAFGIGQLYTKFMRKAPSALL